MSGAPRLGIAALAALLAALAAGESDPWAALAPRQAWLVFAAPAATGTAGSFGHVFLRLDGDGGQVAVLYAADPESYARDGPCALAWKGLTGGYTASLQVTPWAAELAGFRDQEGRALWLYPLRLGDAEFARLLAEIAARQGEARPYHLIGDNCAAGIARLLAAAAPESGIGAKARRWPSPAGVVRAAEAAGLIGAGERIAGPAPRRDDARTLSPPLRLGIAAGRDRERAFAEASLRLAWAALDDPASGLPPGDELRLAEAAVRADEDGGRRLQRLTVLAVQACSQDPRRPLGPAWRAELGLRRVRGAPRAGLEAGAGASALPSGGAALWALLSGEGAWATDAQEAVAALGGELGLHAQLADAALWLRAGRSRQWPPTPSWCTRTALGLAWAPARAWSLALEGAWEGASRAEAQLAWRTYW